MILLSDATKDVYENIRNLMNVIEKSYEPVIKIQERLDEMMKPFATLQIRMQKLTEPIEKLSKLFEQYAIQLKKNFVDTISILDPPETYNPNIELHSGIHKTAIGMVAFVDEMDNHPFYYLKERMLIGISAHLDGNYHLSLYALFSTIDGMLSWFYTQNHQGQKYPDINMKLKEFFEAYDFENIVGKKEIRPKFENFFRHRNEIMHGGENSHFDKNLSTAALLFLGIVYSSLTTKK